MSMLIQTAVSQIHKPHSWLGVATFVACCVAGWYCGDIAHAVSEKLKGE
ncbi:hypothetical protein SAMN05443245_7427 [Paraburkholderia fungorum]|uniref:Uncharacterized protein n=1 Tax=Paraburkholderia fungorum TaxID=134537 RepID=A0A1H1JXF7_9BURK|nr:hypothetical protein [Paraburkholderia fungorum]SDR54439.1 hypothetical protein SAMN05443245_7427 [Paraburkholderia fungorum]